MIFACSTKHELGPSALEGFGVELGWQGPSLANASGSGGRCLLLGADPRGHAGRRPFLRKGTSAEFGGLRVSLGR